MTESASPPEFRAALRGYDRNDVDAWVESVTQRIGELEEERNQLRERIESMGGTTDRDLRSEFDAISEEVGTILQAAREAAEGMRTRAAEDAARWRAEADTHATRVRTEADRDSKRLREEAWTTGSEMLSQSQAAADSLRHQAREDSLVIRAEAEREAHALTAAARRELDEATRVAKAEAERILDQARLDSQTMIEDARREAEAAQERARALEQRRAELMAELEAARASIAQLENSLDGREVAQAPVADAESEWSDGEASVRIVGRAAAGPVGYEDEEFDDGPVDAVAMAEEVQRLRQTAERAPVPPAATDDDDEDDLFAPVAVGAEEKVAVIAPLEAAEDIVVVIEPEPEDEPGPVPVAAEPPDDVTPARPVTASSSADPEPDTSEIDDLFSRLRTHTPPSPRPDPPASPQAADAAAVAVKERAGPVEPPAPPVLDGDAFELRDRLLLPVSNRALRNLKRVIVDLQNVALEELRVKGDDWEPAVTEVEAGLGDDLAILARESRMAGYAASAELAGTDATPQPAGTEPDDPTTEVAAALHAAVMDALDRARAAGSSARQVASAVSRVYRGWRTDEAERRVRAASFTAYHQGVLEGLAVSGVDTVRGIADGRTCDVCPAAGGEGWHPGERAPAGTAVPPAYVDCACTVVPTG